MEDIQVQAAILVLAVPIACIVVLAFPDSVIRRSYRAGTSGLGQRRTQ